MWEYHHNVLIKVVTYEETVPPIGFSTMDKKKRLQKSELANDIVCASSSLLALQP